MKQNPAEYTFFRVEKPGYLEITRQQIPLNCPEFKTELMDYLSKMDSSVKKLIINFSKVEYVTTSCPAILIQVLATAKKQKIALSLEGIIGKVANQLEITKLKSIFELAQHN